MTEMLICLKMQIEKKTRINQKCKLQIDKKIACELDIVMID